MITENLSIRNKCILITGAAGFIGSNLVMELFRTVLPLHRCNHNSCKGICPEPQNRTYFEPISPPSAVPSDQPDFLKNSKA